MALFERDLTFINDGNEERLPMPQKPEVKLPNFEKMVLLGQQILELEAYRKVHMPPINANKYDFVFLKKGIYLLNKYNHCIIGNYYWELLLLTRAISSFWGATC